MSVKEQGLSAKKAEKKSSTLEGHFINLLKMCV